MIDHKPQQHFAHAARIGLRPVSGFRAQHFGMRRREIGKLTLAKQHARTRQQRLRGPFGFRDCIRADNGHGGDAAPAILIGRGDLVLRCRRIAPGAGDANAVVARLLELDLREIRDHVGKDVGRRIADFVQHLFGDGGRHDQPAGIVWLPQREAAVDFAGRDRIADIFPARHLLPIGMHAAGRLRPAFEDVTHKAAGCEPVVIVGRPAEFMHQDAERQRRIRATPGDDDIGATIERRRDRQRAEIGVGGQKLRRQRFARRSFADRGAQRVDARHHVVAVRPPRSSATVQVRRTPPPARASRPAD